MRRDQVPAWPTPLPPQNQRRLQFSTPVRPRRGGARAREDDAPTPLVRRCVRDKSRCALPGTGGAASAPSGPNINAAQFVSPPPLPPTHTQPLALQVHTVAQPPMSPPCQPLSVEALLPIPALRGALESGSPGSSSPRSQVRALETPGGRGGSKGLRALAAAKLCCVSPQRPHPCAHPSRTPTPLV